MKSPKVKYVKAYGNECRCCETLDIRMYEKSKDAWKQMREAYNTG